MSTNVNGCVDLKCYPSHRLDVISINDTCLTGNNGLTHADSLNTLQDYSIFLDLPVVEAELLLPHEKGFFCFLFLLLLLFLFF